MYVDANARIIDDILALTYLHLAPKPNRALFGHEVISSAEAFCARVFIHCSAITQHATASRPLYPGNAHMFLFGMDSIFAIGLGLALRIVVDAASQHDLRLGGSLIGLWEGAVLYHFLDKWPKSFDPYIAFVFRLFVDFLFTENLTRLTIVLLWAGLGMLISDITPAFWYDKGLRRVYRRTRRFFRRLSFGSLKLPWPLTSNTISRVRFYEIPRSTTARSTVSFSSTTTSSGAGASTPIASPRVRVSRRPVPGAFPGYGSETSATDVSVSRRPVAASSVPPSTMRSRWAPKPASSLGIENIPLITELPTIEDVIEDAGERTPTSHSAELPLPIPPPGISMPEPEPFMHDATTSMPIPEIPPTTPSFPEPSQPAFRIIMDNLPEINPGGEYVTDERNPPSYEDVPVLSENKDKGKEVADNRSDDNETVRSSVISTGSRSSIIRRADMMRDEANAEEVRRDQFGMERKKALREKRYADALRLKVEYEEAHERVTNLHKRAEHRYFHGMRPPLRGPRISR